MGNSAIPEGERPIIEGSDERSQSPDRPESQVSDTEATPTGPPPGLLYSPVHNENRPISDIFELLD
jgi:hypothetical protein